MEFVLFAKSSPTQKSLRHFCVSRVPRTPYPSVRVIHSDTKKRELLKNPTKIEEIQEKNLLTEIKPLKLAF